MSPHHPVQSVLPMTRQYGLTSRQRMSSVELIEKVPDERGHCPIHLNTQVPNSLVDEFQDGRVNGPLNSNDVEDIHSLLDEIEVPLGEVVELDEALVFQDV